MKGEGTFCNLHVEGREWDVHVQFEENAHVGASAEGVRCLVEGEGTYCNLKT